MSTVYTPWYAYGSGGLYRLELQIDDPPAVGSGTASVDLTARLYLETNGSLTDSSNTNTISGDLGTHSASASVSHSAYPTGGRTLVKTESGTIATVYGSTVRVDVSGSISGYEALTNRSISGYVTVPARPYTAPTAPSGVSVARVSDTQHTVTWTRNASTAAPYSSQKVQRSTDGGSWATVATVSGTATSYSDTTTSADHSYAYRVMAVNDAGSTASSSSSTVYTTPKAPGTPSAVKSGTNIVLSFTNTARHDAGIKVYHSADGGAFTLLATVATANLTTYTHASPSSSQTHAYKVATYNGSLISAQSAASNTVTLASAPNAPTNVQATPAVGPADEAVSITWQYNPTDSSEQTKYQVQWRVQGDATWLDAVVGATSVPLYAFVPSIDLSASNGTTLEFRVRTWGQDAGLASPYSATFTLVLTSRPTATISSPADAGEITTSAVTVEWAYYDAEASDQSAWQARLLDSVGAEVELLTDSGAATSATFAHVLGDGTEWTVQVQVRDGAGLWSLADSVDFSVAYALPPTPTLTATWDPETGSVALEVATADPVDPEVAAVSLDVYRSINSEPFALLATGLPPSTVLTDWSPTVAGQTAYHAVAVSSLPSVAQSADVAVSTPQAGDRKSVWLSGGPGFSQVCRASSNVRVFEVRGRAAKVLHRYAGRTYPVETVGAGLARSLSLGVDIITSSAADGTTSPPAEWLALAELAGPHLWRDPDGRYVYVSISDVQIARDPSGVITGMTVSAEQIDA